MTTDFLIIGGGILGIAVAREIRRVFPDSSVLLIEKEAAPGLHASGRNSGVLHAGFYYTEDSLKARFTRDGNERLTRYCLDHGLSLNRCGKLVVARDESELPILNELFRRGRINGVTLEKLTSADVREIEPRALTCQEALFSPATSVADPREVMTSLVRDAQDAGVRVQSDTAFIGYRSGQVITTRGVISAGYIVNAGGLYADRIASAFGFSKYYRILPFKGLYVYGNEPPGAIRTNIYPVPRLENPFLGVHVTVTAGGRVKLGPTAIPVLWREHYHGLEKFNLMEMLDTMGTGTRLLTGNNFKLLKLGMSELLGGSKKGILQAASTLVRGLNSGDYRNWGQPGIRAQLLDIRNGQLVMDFLWEGDSSSFHILNAVSPAFTCALSFSEYIVGKINGLLDGSPGPGRDVDRSYKLDQYES
jgi:L-2-hydroxyglutarate oxidase LhgO